MKIKNFCVSSGYICGTVSGVIKNIEEKQNEKTRPHYVRTYSKATKILLDITECIF